MFSLVDFFEADQILWGETVVDGHHRKLVRFCILTAFHFDTGIDRGFVFNFCAT